MKKITVDLVERPYDILIDQHLLMGVGEEVLKYFVPGTQVAVLVSQTVKKLYFDRVERSLVTKGFSVKAYHIPSGEGHKTLDTVSQLYDELIEDNIDRSSCILALGGGIVGDVTGFVASSLYRGIPFVQVPTTLLSQIDSSVGGKVGVNHPQGKNLIGAFYQPKTVLIDPTVLKTLDPREVVCGLGEMLKYGFIRDAELLQQCFDRRDDILKLKDMEIVSELIARSVEIKADIVTRDERESGMRMLLNFGHTIGHALEKSCGFGKFLHGEAVILGMCAALKLSMDMSGLDPVAGSNAINELLSIPLGHDLKDLDIDEAMNALTHDKKIRNGKLNFVLLKELGRPVIVPDIERSAIRSILLWLKEHVKQGA